MENEDSQQPNSLLIKGFGIIVGYYIGSLVNHRERFILGTRYILLTNGTIYSVLGIGI